MLIVCSLATTKTIRQQVFSFLFFAGLLLTCMRVERGQRALLAIIPPLFALWANFHGGWLVGLGVLGIWTAVRCVSPVGAGRVSWAAAGIAAIAATLANPYGTALWAFLTRPFRSAV